MCGITGIFNRDGRPVNPTTLVKMTRSLIHRGPDEEGYFLNARCGSHPDAVGFRQLGASVQDCPGNVGFGHRRLSIIDLKSGQQPLSNEDGTIWISFNGEIYNFMSLMRDLQSRGHRFRTCSDTETIVHAYEEWGTECLQRFRGMFSFAVWDQRKQELFIARDRLGKKPLFYLQDHRRFLFASEIKGILKCEDVSREIDVEALSDYLSLLYVPAPKSIFLSIKKLPAGHYAIISADKSEIRKYWDLKFNALHDLSAGRMQEDLLNILDEATRLRMISDVPLGAFLSGGVDSSAVVAFMSKASAEPVKTNAVTFSNQKYDESKFARAIASRFGADHHEYMVEPDAVSIIEHLGWHYDEPFADSSAVPTYYVSRETRKRVTVALSGDGGDENFAGYRRYYFDLLEERVRNFLPGSVRRPLFGSIGWLYPKADYLPRMFRGKTFLSNIARDSAEGYCFSMSAFQEETKHRLLRPEIRSNLRGYRTDSMFRELYSKAPADDHLSKIQYLDIKTYLAEQILTKVDRASMAVSLEVRSPILDHVFMEYVAGIPSNLKLVGQDGKRIFKQALIRQVPSEMLWRPKMGFTMPICEWFRGSLKDYLYGCAIEGPATSRYLNRPYVEDLYTRHVKGLRDMTAELWAVLMLNIWHTNFSGEQM